MKFLIKCNLNVTKFCIYEQFYVSQSMTYFSMNIFIEPTFHSVLEVNGHCEIFFVVKNLKEEFRPHHSELMFPEILIVLEQF